MGVPVELHQDPVFGELEKFIPYMIVVDFRHLI